MRCPQDDKLKDYKACLFGGGPSYRSQLMFRSSKHKVRMLEVHKLALSRDDDNRIYLNNVNSLAGENYALRVGPLGRP